jgi:hypothetical protein
MRAREREGGRERELVLLLYLKHLRRYGNGPRVYCDKVLCWWEYTYHHTKSLTHDNTVQWASKGGRTELTTTVILQLTDFPKLGDIGPGGHHQAQRRDPSTRPGQKRGRLERRDEA